MGGHDLSDILCHWSRGVAMVTAFLARIGENWHSPPLFCELAFHIGWQDCKVHDARIYTADNPSMSDKKFGDLWSSDPWVLQARLHRAGYTLDFSTHFSLCLFRDAQLVRIAVFAVQSGQQWMKTTNYRQISTKNSSEKFTRKEVWSCRNRTLVFVRVFSWFATGVYYH